jgi:hypothetical protein
MGKHHPQKYGNTDRLELTGAGGGPILLAAIATVAVEHLQAERAYAMKGAQAADNEADEGQRNLNHTPTPTER